MKSYKFLFFIFKVFLSKVFLIKEVKNIKDKKIFNDIWSSSWVSHGFVTEKEKALRKYKKNDNVSTDIIITFLGIISIGTIRLQWDKQPALKDFKVQKTWPGEAVEFTLFTVKKKYRFFGIPSLMLMREGYRQAVRKNVDGIIMITEKWLFTLLSKRLLFPFRQVSPKKEYEGGSCFVSFMLLEEGKKILAEKSPELLKLFTS